MLRTIPAWRLAEWKIFYELEPDIDERLDWNFARMVQAFIHDGKTPLSDYRIPFGDTPDTKRERRQSIEYQTRLIEAWITTSNAIFTQQHGN